jgi:tRNA (adenine22-N1)-methyltransferase
MEGEVRETSQGSGVFSLSVRLRAVAERVLHGRPLADVGTDHGLLPAWCVAVGRVPRAIAIDVRPGPLEAAHRTLRSLAAVEVRRGSGLRPLRVDEVATVVLAGLGGPRIRRLVDARPEVVRRIDRLVLQPNTQWSETRAWIRDHRWALEDERLVEDAGKHYLVLTVRPRRGRRPDWDERDLLLGPHVRRHPTLAFERHRARLVAETRAALDAILAFGRPGSPRAAELRHRLDLLTSG